MLRPRIVRTSSGSSGEKIVEMVSHKLNRLSHNLHFSANGDEITVISQTEPIAMKEYFYSKSSIKELIRMI